MSRTWITNLIASFTIVNATLAWATMPYNPHELTIIQQHLVKNIATEKNVVNKNDEGNLITSLPGAVLASPTYHGNRFSQDYQFHWTRDAALSINALLHLYEQTHNSELKNYLYHYVDFEQSATRQSSKPGENTLGQPKFNIDSSVWEGPWGRPQNDGPALRAITLIEFANILLKEHETTYVKNKLLPLIQIDLAYIVSEWRNPNFDLWEEVNDPDHFFTKIVQRKSLILGASLLKHFNESSRSAIYSATANDIAKSLQQHWDPQLGYLTETINQKNNKGGGLDSSIVLGVLHGHTSDQLDEFTVNNEKVMITVYALRNVFAQLYPINIEHHQEAPLIGRYPSDIYDGDQFKYGNPWILATNAIGQYYYALARTYLRLNVIKITKLNHVFFDQLGLQLYESNIDATKNPVIFKQIIFRLIDQGDKFLLTAKQYGSCTDAGDCYHFAEQVDKYSGNPTSAKDLTWNYASIITAMNERNKI